MGRQDDVCVLYGYFKNRQATAGQWSPMGSLPFGISRATEHRNVTSIGPGRIVDFCPRTNPTVVTESMRVRDGAPLPEPKIKQPTPYPPLYKYPSTSEEVLE